MRTVIRLLPLIYLFLCAANYKVHAETTLPRIVVLATGGTIAGSAMSKIKSSSYQAATVPIKDLLDGISEVNKIADLQEEQLFQIPSEDITNSNMLTLSKRVNELLNQSDIDGIVITHGTDTLEETSYFLNLTVKSKKPVVMVASMRPSTSLSADGPLNLYDAIAVAASSSASGRGVLVVLNDHIYSGRDVSKMINVSPNAFVSPWGSLGMIVERRPYWFRKIDKRHTYQTEFNVSNIESLPIVDIAYGYSNVDDSAISAFLNKGDKAIIFAGTGNGSIPKKLVGVLRNAKASGVQIIRSSHVNLGGIVLRNAEQPDDQYGWIVAHDLNPQKAKILATLALTKTSDYRDIQRMFWEY